MKIAKPLLYVFFIGAIAALGFILWANATMGPEQEALAALRSDEHVTVRLDQFIVFQPANKKPRMALVFYPGGRIDYRSYAAPLRKIAAEGYLVILMPVRLNLAFFDTNAADRAIAAFPEIRQWVVGGHSLGGVAAAAYAGRAMPENLDGVILWASYPADNTLRHTGLKVLSIYGSLDMDVVDRLKTSRANLPEDAEFVVIDGGNHSQFGHYGLQPGDAKATITRLEQQKQIVKSTVQFLKEISQ
jgi:pimeloyl-ACP methyl ester carboxylesterase